MVGKSLLTTVSVAALTFGLNVGGASAADLGPVYTPAPAAPAASTWTGFYFGGHFGGGWMLADGLFSPSELPGAEWEDDFGLVVGAHAGYNWQTDGFVWGVEADVSATGFDSKACHDSSKCPGAAGSEVAYASIDMLGSLRLRLGMPFQEKSLVYVTGGVAYRDGTWMASEAGLNAGDKDLDKVGGVVGAGWEYRANEHFSARVEGLWYIFDDNTAPYEFCQVASCPGTNFDSDPLVIRIGGSYHFN